MPGWRNWQTQRTQNPPIARSWGFDPPSRHQDNKRLIAKMPDSASRAFLVGGCFGGCSFFAFRLFGGWWLFGGRSRDPFDHRKFVGWGQVAVTGRHRDGLVSRRLLNLFDGCPGHCQPGAKGMAVGVPDVSGDLRLCEAGLEPGPRIEPALHAFAQEHRIGWPVEWML